MKSKKSLFILKNVYLGIYYNNLEVTVAQLVQLLLLIALPWYYVLSVVWNDPGNAFYILV